VSSTDRSPALPRFARQGVGGLAVKSLSIGQSASKVRSFTQQDVIDYRELTGDCAEDYLVPAPLIGGMFSDLLGTELPGRGTNWMKQSFRFVAAPRVGTQLIATVQVVRLRPDKDLVNLRTICIDTFGRLVCDGEALVMAREMA
jgi:3-hydroxybutyryl-CoA dehydratase